MVVASVSRSRLLAREELLQGVGQQLVGQPCPDAAPSSSPAATLSRMAVIS